MSLENEHRLRFRDAMASLGAAVNIVTTDGTEGRCGITATAVCSVTDTPPTLMVCVNRNSAMNAVFQKNGRLCVNVLSHDQEELACHFAGMKGSTMEERFSWNVWDNGILQQPLLKNALANLEGEITQVQDIGTGADEVIQHHQDGINRFVGTGGAERMTGQRFGGTD